VVCKEGTCGKLKRLRLEMWLSAGRQVVLDVGGASRLGGGKVRKGVNPTLVESSARRTLSGLVNSLLS
jgi:hypothetical protein